MADLAVDPDELIAGLSHKYVILIAATVLYYEYGHTLSREVAYVWCAKPQLTCINILFYLNRYMSLFAPVAFILQAMWLPSDHPHKVEVSTSGRVSYLLQLFDFIARLNMFCGQTCTRLSSFHMYFSVAVQLVVGVFLVMRTYALYNGNRWILGVLVAAASAVLANGIYNVSSNFGTWNKTEYTDLLAIYGCTLPMAAQTARKHAAAWAGLIGLDVLIFVLTLYKSIAEIRYGGSTIMRILLRDGAIYFGIMAIFTSMTMVTYLAFAPYYRGNLVTITNALSSIMMSRLLFNLRDPSLCCRSRYIPGNTTVSYSRRPSESEAVPIDEEYEHTIACRERNNDSRQWTMTSMNSQTG